MAAKGKPTPPVAPITRRPTGPTAKGGTTDLPVSTAYLQFFNRLVDFIASITQWGLLADRPPANSVYPGTLYFATDTNLVYVSDGANWLPFSGAPGITELTGDVLAGPGSGSQVATIAAHAVTYAKIQAVAAASRLLGRGTAGGADVREIDLGPGLSMAGNTLDATGVGTVTDVTATAPIASSGGATPDISLNDSAVTAGVYGDASNVPQVTVDAKGLVQDVTLVPIAAPFGPTQAFRNSGDGATTVFNLPDTADYLLLVSVAGLVMDPAADYSLTGAGTEITFTVAPGAGDVITALYVQLI